MAQEAYENAEKVAKSEVDKIIVECKQNVSEKQTEFDDANAKKLVADNNLLASLQAKQNASAALLGAQTTLNLQASLHPEAEQTLEIDQLNVDQTRAGITQAYNDLGVAEMRVDLAKIAVGEANRSYDDAATNKQNAETTLAQIQYQYDQANQQLSATKSALENMQAGDPGYDDIFTQMQIFQGQVDGLSDQLRTQTGIVETATETLRLAGIAKSAADLEVTNANVNKKQKEDAIGPAERANWQAERIFESDKKTYVDYIAAKAEVDKATAALNTAQTDFTNAQATWSAAETVYSNADKELTNAKNAQSLAEKINFADPASYAEYPELKPVIVALTEAEIDFFTKAFIWDDANGILNEKNDELENAEKAYTDAISAYAIAKADYDAFKDTNTTDTSDKNTAVTETSGDAPNTGDSSNLDLKILSLIGAAGVMAVSRKKSKTK